MFAFLRGGGQKTGCEAFRRELLSGQWRVTPASASVSKGESVLTDANVFEEPADGLAVVEQGPVGGEERARTVRQRVVVQVVELAVVLEADRVLFVEIRAAEELVLDLAGSCASRFAAGLFLRDIRDV